MLNVQKLTLQNVLQQNVLLVTEKALLVIIVFSVLQIAHYAKLIMQNVILENANLDICYLVLDYVMHVQLIALHVPLLPNALMLDVLKDMG